MIFNISCDSLKSELTSVNIITLVSYTNIIPLVCVQVTQESHSHWLPLL